jgi:hypothetical protein
VNLMLYVPVRTGDAGVLTLRTARLESGERTGLAFTSQDALARTLGPAQRWVNLAEPSLRDMLAPLGIRQLRIDPLPLPRQVKPRMIPNDFGFLPPVPLPLAAGLGHRPPGGVRYCRAQARPFRQPKDSGDATKH